MTARKPLVRSDTTGLSEATTLNNADVGLGNVTNDVQVKAAIGTEIGDLISFSAAATPVRVAPNTSTVQKFLAQTGNGSTSDLPSWQTFPSHGSFTYYLTNTASDVSTYLQSTIAPYSPKTTQNYSGIGTSPVVLKNWVTVPGSPGLTFIPAGTYILHIHTSNTGPGNVYLYGELWECNSAGVDIAKIGTTETTRDVSGAYLGNTEAEYEISFINANVYILSSTASRLVLRLYGVASGGTRGAEVYVGGTADTHIELPASTVDATNFVPYTGATGDVNLGAHSLTGTQLISNIATGTPPLSVTSTTPVPNLSIGGNAATVTNATFTTAFTNNGGAGTITWPVAGATLVIPTGGGTLGTGAFTAAYVLPVATSSILGGIMPDGLSLSISATGKVGVNPPYLPSKQGAVYSQSGLYEYINQIARGGQFVPEVNAYTHGVTALVTAYFGGCYSVGQNRIYLIPYHQATASVWHYLDCSNGSITSYTHGVTAVDQAYGGGVYSPNQKRIYMVPNGQSTAAVWHYIDCTNSSVVAYTHGATVFAGGYFGGIYSPTQDRIYMIPFGQGSAAIWHYIDCTNGSVVAYTHGASVIGSAYLGGCLSPAQNRIYMVPSAQATTSVWHYIDCTNGSIVAYTHGATTVSLPYRGASYSPFQNRIYFSPFNQATASVWHYIDCSSGSIVAYTHGATAVASGYFGSCFVPTQNRIYLTPFNQATASVWHYIDCLSGSIVAYTHGATAVVGAYFGGIYSPLQNRNYFVPYNEGTAAVWHYIDCDCGDGTYPSKWLMSGPIFNKY